MLTTGAAPLRIGGRFLAILAGIGTTLLLADRPLQSGSQKPPAVRGDEILSVEMIWVMPKIDAHIHVSNLGADQREKLNSFLSAGNFKWLDICTGGMDWERLKLRTETARSLHRAFPARVGWATSFNLANWSDGDWLNTTRAFLEEGFASGSLAVKVWKEIGMELKDPDGRYVMIDDPRFDPVLDHIERQGRPLVTHLGEPRNCWLPLASMTTDSDRRYFGNNPQYHGYLHPEIPDYWKQIAARDRILERHPRLRVVGSHLGSLEFDVDELAKRLDRYPNFAVDLAARMVHLQIQPREKVRNFLMKYQDKILYATDLELSGSDGGKTADMEKQLARIESVYRLDAAWLATDAMVDVPRASPTFKSRGLALPAQVLRKLYFENARRWYPGL